MKGAVSLANVTMLPVATECANWVQVVSHLDPKYGGLSATVPALARTLAQDPAFDVSIAAFCGVDERCRPENFDAQKVSHWPMGRKTWLRNQPLRSAFTLELQRADGVHIHGLWEQSTAIAARTARLLGVPYILSAHGMLEPWALANKRLKKLLYSFLVERGNVGGAACLHALTRAEADHYIRFGARCPIAIIPNAVELPKLESRTFFFHRFPALQDKRIVLFLGRLHPKKGLDILLKAWASIASDWPDARLVLAGPDSEGTRERLEEFVASHHLQSSVFFTGMLQNEMKWGALAAAECFVLPSYSEGLSVGVLEAMGMGVPVIVTRQCNMPQVEQHQAGWQIEPNLDQLTSVLRECLCHSRYENVQIGARGADLVDCDYTWPTIARKMSEVYRWVAGGPIPASVELVFP